MNPADVIDMKSFLLELRDIRPFLQRQGFRPYKVGGVYGRYFNQEIHLLKGYEVEGFERGISMVRLMVDTEADDCHVHIQFGYGLGLKYRQRFVPCLSERVLRWHLPEHSHAAEYRREFECGIVDLLKALNTEHADFEAFQEAICVSNDPRPQVMYTHRDRPRFARRKSSNKIPLPIRRGRYSTRRLWRPIVRYR